MGYEVDRETLKKWHEALVAEDCCRVKELLKSDKRLLHHLWEASQPLFFSLRLKEAKQGRTALHVAARRGDRELVVQILSLAGERGDSSLDPVDVLDNLLGMVDGGYDLDALAMAVVSGSRDIVDLLKTASLGCKLNPWGIGNDAESARNGADRAAQSPQMGPIHPLETIIEKVQGALDEDSKKKVRELYNADCNFNFLPMSTYLFHFTFSTWKSTRDQRALIRKVRQQIFDEAFTQVPTMGKHLLFGFFDGRGRSPLHVSVDSNKTDAFLELVKSADLALKIPACEHPGKEGANVPCEDCAKKAPLDLKFIGDILNEKDGAGRTPLFRAAAKNRYWVVQQLLKDERVEVNVGLQCNADSWGADLDLDKLSMKNGFKSRCMFITKAKIEDRGFNKKSTSPGVHVEPLSTTYSSPLHMAIIHRHEHVVKIIVDKLLQTPSKDPGERCSRPLPWPVAPDWKSDPITVEDEDSQNSDDDSASEAQVVRKAFPAPYEVSTMQLAVLVGCIPILQHLLKAERDKPGLFTGPEEKDLPSFLLAAASGKPGAIKAFLNGQGRNSDPVNKRDCLGNTALHQAVRGRDAKVYPHLLDFVGCGHVFNWRWESDDRLSSWVANPHDSKNVTKDVEKDGTGKFKDHEGLRQGSILLLLQAGVDILARNNLSHTASPDPNAPQEFVKWWYEKEVQETQQMQKSLNDAANAISVTAALVATASFVGPLQPPLSYGGEPLGLQVDDISVRIFIVCDTLSFYFALAAIMLALLPSLPKPQHSAFNLLARTKRLVAGAVAFLFPAIICVLVAFGAASIAVIRVGGFSQQYLTVTTTIIGGFFCLRVMKSFIDGLLRFLITSLPSDALEKGDLKTVYGKVFVKALIDLFLFGCESCIPIGFKEGLNSFDSKRKRKIS